MSETKPPTKRLPIFLVIIFVALALSFVAFQWAVRAYMADNPGYGNYLLMMGILGLALSAYYLFQMRRGVPQPIFQPQKAATTILCEKCGFKNVREFQRGDYIFKDVEACPKCNEKMVIASIHREAQEKP